MRALVALGGNLGDRRALLHAAQRQLGRLPATRLLGASTLRETAPETPSDGGPFLNGAALLETALPPRALLAHLLAIERRCGRRRSASAHRGPRLLDLDLILYGALRLRRPGLELPHPRFRVREFVLAPAAEVAPSLRDPQTGLTIRELLAGLRAGPSQASRAG